MNGIARLAALTASVLIANRLLSWLFPRYPHGDSSMFDCAKEITQFHDQDVRLPKATQDKLRGHRQANQNRLKQGLEINEDPSVKEFVKQGSYAMYTINQHPNNDYDIDDGAAFIKEELVGPRGAELSPLQARQMVRDAIDDGSFKQAPEVRANCVRVFYQAGHHVDIPVYRICPDPDSDGETYLELASASGWRESDPRSVTKWYNDAVTVKSPDSINGQQMRRITRLMKAFAKSRDSWNSPSGFILSVLVDECYEADKDRDDVALYNTMRCIHDRLENDLAVRHPILSEDLTKTDNDPCMRDFREHLGQALDDLQILHDEDDCSRKAALKAWKKVFNHPFFDNKIEEEAGTRSAGLAAGGAPSGPVEKRGNSRFA